MGNPQKPLNIPGATTNTLSMLVRHVYWGRQLYDYQMRPQTKGHCQQISESL